MPRPLTILYAGCSLSGRTQSLIHIARLPGEFPSPWDVSIRLAGGFDWTWREQARRIRTASLLTGTWYYESVAEAARASFAGHRGSAERAASLIPHVDGMVLVVDSQAERREANLESLERWLDELMRAGVVSDRLPVVFQLNKRDLPNAMSVEDLKQDLRTPLCDYVESIASSRLGVDEALARLIAMIDDREARPGQDGRDQD